MLDCDLTKKGLPVADNTAAKTFLLEHSKVDGATRTLTLSNYLKFEEELHQHSRELLESLTASKTALVTAAIEIITDDAVKIIEKRKEDGEDYSDVTTEFKATRPDGRFGLTLSGQRTVTNPANGERMLQHGSLRLRDDVKTLVDPTSANNTRSRIAAHYSD